MRGGNGAADVYVVSDIYSTSYVLANEDEHTDGGADGDKYASSDGYADVDVDANEYADRSSDGDAD